MILEQASDKLVSSLTAVSIRETDLYEDGESQECERYRQRREIGNDMGTAGGLLCGYHAPGLKKIRACRQL
jgi:hypothetical protein